MFFRNISPKRNKITPPSVYIVEAHFSPKKEEVKITKVKVKREIPGYFQEGIVALLPTYDQEGSSSRIYTREGEYADSRSLRWLLTSAAQYYGGDISSLRKQYGDFLQRWHTVPLPLSPELILLPLKMRQARVKGDTTIGYINGLLVEEVGGSDSKVAPHLSRILFKGGFTLPCYNSQTTVKNRLLQGESVHREYRRRQGSSTAAGPCGTRGEVFYSCPALEFFKQMLEAAFKENKDKNYNLTPPPPKIRVGGVLSACVTFSH